MTKDKDKVYLKIFTRPISIFEDGEYLDIEDDTKKQIYKDINK
jgi:hypothetical protein